MKKLKEFIFSSAGAKSISVVIVILIWIAVAVLFPRLENELNVICTLYIGVFILDLFSILVMEKWPTYLFSVLLLLTPFIEIGWSLYAGKSISEIFDPEKIDISLQIISLPGFIVVTFVPPILLMYVGYKIRKHRC